MSDAGTVVLDRPEVQEDQEEASEQQPTMKIFSARKKVIRVLLDGPVVDEKGSATARMAERAGFNVESRSTTALMGAMERDGLIRREKSGRRTYRIELVEPAPHPRYQELIAQMRAEKAAQAAEEQVEEAEAENDPTGVLARLEEAQAAYDEPVAPVAPVAGIRLSNGSGPALAVAPAPEPEPDPVDYSALAMALLDRVGKVLSEDKTYLQQAMDRVVADRDKARADLARAREEAQRVRVRFSEMEDQVVTLRNQNAALRGQVRERDENIAKLVREHNEVAGRAVSEYTRKEIERTMREEPRVGRQPIG